MSSKMVIHVWESFWFWLELGEVEWYWGFIDKQMAPGLDP